MQTTSTHSNLLYRLCGDYDAHPFHYWASAFGTAKAHQLIDSHVLIEDIDDSEFDAGWTEGYIENIEIDLANGTWEVQR